VQARNYNHSQVLLCKLEQDVTQRRFFIPARVFRLDSARQDEQPRIQGIIEVRIGQYVRQGVCLHAVVVA